MDGSRRLTAAIVASTLAVGGCAPLHPAPPADAPPQSIRLTTSQMVLGPGWMLGWGTGTSQTSAPEPLPGARCTASNDRGSWTVVTPGVLEVARSRSPLTITCRHEGFRDSRVVRACITPRASASAGGALAGLNLASAAGPVMVAALPAAAIVAAVAGAAVLGGAAGNAVAGTGPNADLCDYGDAGEVQVVLSPAG